MKRIIATLLVLASTISLHAQPRNAGRLVVPIGFENSDSIRFGLWQGEDARVYLTGLYWGSLGDTRTNALTNAYYDSLQSNEEHYFGSINIGVTFGPRRLGFSGMNLL